MKIEHKIFQTEFAGREVTVETGKTSEFANGSCWVRYGDTVVMVHAVMSAKPREGVDFFPLSVDYEEKLYAAGKIPGSFLKRESRPSEKAILTARVIDRPIRPLFPKDMRNDVSIVATVLSTDIDNAPEIAAMLGTSVALSISDIPWNGPVVSVAVGLVDGKIILNPNERDRALSSLDLTVCGSHEKIVMIEAGADQVDEETMLRCIEAGHQEIKKMTAFVQAIQEAVGKEKVSFSPQIVPDSLMKEIEIIAKGDVEHALDTNDKNVREERLAPIITLLHEKFDEAYKGNESIIDTAIYQLEKSIVRNWLLNEKRRVDNRGMDEMRPLSAEVSLLPRVHGSGMFTRGQTQVLSIATLGSLRDEQRLDGIDEFTKKRYLHQYNFPSYSVGETRPSRGPGRREIGHGALAERALIPVLPTEEEFPYAIRVVSEVLSSNGSTSQASICGSTLALMDAGVPIKEPVAGISCGLITDDNGDYMTMVDIQGLEDFFGDMDFKVGGTRNGITAIQVDIKVDGLSMDIIAEAFEKTRKARLYILDQVIAKAIPTYRDEVTQYAPKIAQTVIPMDKIREVIGTGGKVVQKICADFDVKIDISEEGYVYIMGIDRENVQSALSVVETIVNDPEIGAVYRGRVTRIMTFGAFVEIAPGKEGLVHISNLDFQHVNNVADVVQVGDEIVVKVMEIDAQGRINLSRRDAIIALQEKT